MRIVLLVLASASFLSACGPTRAVTASTSEATTNATLCQAWFPVEKTSTPPANLLQCQNDAQCGYSVVRACCGFFVVARNASQAGCIAEQTSDANCRAHCVSPPAGTTPMHERPGFQTLCVEGACILRGDGETDTSSRFEAIP